MGNQPAYVLFHDIGCFRLSEEANPMSVCACPPCCDTLPVRIQAAFHDGQLSYHMTAELSHDVPRGEKKHEKLAFLFHQD